MWLVWSDHMTARIEQLDWNHEKSNSKTRDCSKTTMFLDRFE